MAAAAGPYVAWMSTTATLAEQTASHAKAAAAGYEVAFAATVPPQVIAANRALLMALVASNLFGQNTPAIAATEAQYAEMWAQDAAAMYGYAGASASATMLTPFIPPPQSTNPGGLAAQAAGLVQAAGTSAASNAQTVLSQLTSALPAALQGLASPLPSTSAAATSASGLTGILQTLGLASPLSGLTGILQTLGITSPASLLEPTSVGLASSELTTSVGAWNSAAQGDEEILDDTSDLSGMEARIMSRFDQLGAVGSAGSASLGQANTIGALSVPPGWAAAAPAIRLAAVALPATSLGAAPEVFAGSPGSLFSQMALASMAGRAIAGTVSPGRWERIGATTRAYQAPSPRSPGGPMTGIAAEISELTELLGKLGVLRDSGILTNEEFNEQKQRLIVH
jgi:PPE-repeat protein